MESKKQPNYPKPPQYLARDSREWWATVVKDYDLSPHDFVLLRRACEAMDRGEQARKTINKEGLTVPTQHGVKTHPAVAVERSSALVFIQLVKAMGLNKSEEAKRPVGRPQQY